MDSGFSGGRPDFFTTGRRPTNLNPQHQFNFQSPFSGIIPDPEVNIRRPDLIGKRSLSEFQQQNQQGSLGFQFQLRNVKQRPNYHHALSPLNFSPVPSNSPNARYGVPVSGPGFLLGSNHENKTMSSKLQELEKELLGDEENDATVSSVITSTDWPETIHQLLGPGPSPKPVYVKTTSPSSSSSCSSTTTSASPQISTKQSFTDAAIAISDGDSSRAAEILTRLHRFADSRGNPEQRLTAYMLSSLKPRVSPTHQPSPPSELYSEPHDSAIQKLYEISPCFKLAFMAANLSILESASALGSRKIHVVDFDVSSGVQYMPFLHALPRAAELRITAVTDSISADLRIAGERLESLANKLGVRLNFSVKKLNNISDVSREKFGINEDETLAVNLAFKLHKLPDESVSTDNLRDDLLRRVKRLSPAVTAVVEHDLNGNTSPLTVRVRENYDYNRALFDSLEETMGRDDSDRVRVEEALGRRMGNSIGFEGKDRVERCEVLGKWRARMGMAGFEPVLIGRPVAEALRVKMESMGTRGNPGFSIDERSGGLCFGWMGRTLTFVSAWR